MYVGCRYVSIILCEGLIYFQMKVPFHVMYLLRNQNHSFCLLNTVDRKIEVIICGPLLPGLAALGTFLYLGLAAPGTKRSLGLAALRT